MIIYGDIWLSSVRSLTMEHHVYVSVFWLVKFVFAAGSIFPHRSTTFSSSISAVAGEAQTCDSRLSTLDWKKKDLVLKCCEASLRQKCKLSALFDPSVLQV